VQQLVQTDKVAALMYSDNATEQAVAPYIKSQGIPVIGGVGYSPVTWSGAANWFPVNTTFPTSITGQVAVAKALGLTNYAGIACGTVPQCQATETLTKPAITSAGLSFAGWQEANPGQPNYTAQCVALNHPDFINLILTPAIGAEVMTDCDQQGYKGVFGICCESFSQSANSSVPAGTKIAGMLDGFPWWVNSPPVNQFRAVMAEYAPGAAYSTTEATDVWSSLQLFRLTMAKVPDPVTAASVIQAYGTIKNETLGGLLPKPLTFTADKVSPQNTCFFLFEWTVGQKNPVVIHSGPSGNGATGPLQSTCAAQ
jgi:branched-chain amino acid transport system substrate-binding protein